MRREDLQRGSTLIMLIGVIAALAIMGTALVTLVVNVRANTGKQRTDVKAFNVAEAGLDNGLYVLGKDWPTYSTSAPAIDETVFGAQYPVDEFPRSTTGEKLIDVQFYDNQETIDTSIHYDKNTDLMMWVDAQATVGTKTRRVRALVQRKTAPIGLPRGVVLYAGGGVWMHGGGTPVGVVPGGLPEAPRR
jgi:hypothetical protein